MKCLLILGWIAMVVVTCSSSVRGDEDAIGGTQSATHAHTKIEFDVDYLLFLPADYEARPSWPLMLFLHGAGERGSDLNLVKKHGPPKIVGTDPDFRFVLVSPQCPKDRWWNPVELTALLDHIVKQYKIDEDRIYVTGLSMGGFGIWLLAAYTPERFAAVAPICGGGESITAHRLAHLPIWAFHGAKDPVVPLSRSQQMVDEVNKHGGQAKLTVYPEASHDAWTQTYANPDLYRWFLQRTRRKQEGTNP